MSFIIWVLIGIGTAYIAYNKGRDPFAWFAIGIFLGLFGLLLLIILPPLKEQEEKENKINSSTTLIVTPELIKPTQNYANLDWHCIDKLHQQQGPIAFDALKALWDDNQIDFQTFVWTEGMPKWQKIADLPELHQGLKETKQESPIRHLEEL